MACGEIERYATGANCVVTVGQSGPMTPDNTQDRTTGDVSRTIPRNPRRAFIDALAIAIRGGVALGDTGLVRVAARALIELHSAEAENVHVTEVATRRPHP